MAKCEHENSVFLENHDLVDRVAVEVAARYIPDHISKHMPDDKRGRDAMLHIITVTERWCPECNAIYGVITAAA